MKRIPLAPTIMTLGNVFCGFVSIGFILRAQAAWSSTHDMALFGRWIGLAGWFIFFGMVFDALDGKVARLSRASSNFGEELDSLADVISFGVAPALMVKVLAAQQRFLPQVAWATSVLFLVCATLRLARFNVETSKEEEAHLYFKGLPTPAAAGFIAALTIMFYELREEAAGGENLAAIARAMAPVLDGLLYAMPFVAVVLAVLMVSNVRYPHALNTVFRRRQPLSYLVSLLLIVFIAWLTKPFSLPVFMVAYILIGIVSAIKNRIYPAQQKRQPVRAQHRPVDDEDDNGKAAKTEGSVRR